MSPFSPSFYAKWPSFFVGDAGFRLIQPLRPQSRLVTVGIDNKYDGKNNDQHEIKIKRMICIYVYKIV